MLPMLRYERVLHKDGDVMQQEARSPQHENGARHAPHSFKMQQIARARKLNRLEPNVSEPVSMVHAGHGSGAETPRALPNFRLPLLCCLVCVCANLCVALRQHVLFSSSNV